jgi:hypothetical protein
MALLQRDWRTLLGRLGLSLLATAMAVYAGELAFRQFLLERSVPETEREFERLVASQWPQAISPAKKRGTIRILGLADSFGVAGADRNYHYLLEEKLRLAGRDVEVVNFSVSAYSPVEELELLRRFAAAYEPDVVLHGFFVGNDFSVRERDNLRFRGITVERTSGVAGWRPRNLLLPRWLLQRAEVWRDARARRSEERRGAIEGGSFSRDSFMRIEAIRMSTCRIPTEPGLAWPRTTRLLDAIRGETASLGALHVLVVHPDQFQVDQALAREIMNRYGLEPADYDLDLPRAYLGAWASSRGVALTDLTEVFRREGRDGSLYLRHDTHYNERGNELAADSIAETLLAILPAPTQLADRAN